MPQDLFANTTDSLIAPASKAFAITPDDATDLAIATKALYVGSAGNIAVRAVGSNDFVVMRNVPNGTVLAIRIAAIRATGTTAADLVGLV